MRPVWCFILFVFLFTVGTFSQGIAAEVLRVDSVPEEGVLLDKDWKFIVGDNPVYANSDYDDGAWESINPALDINDLDQIPKSGIAWFRLRLLINPSIDRQLALIIQQSGASEIYLDGKLIHRFGNLSSDPADVVAYDPLWQPVSFPVKIDTIHVLAVRFAAQPHIRYTTMFTTSNHALWIQIKDVESGVSFYEQQVSRTKLFHVFPIGVCFLFCVLHFAFYLFYPSQKANLYFAMFALFYVTAFALQHIYYLEANEIKYKFFLANFSFGFFMVGNLFLLTAIHHLLNQKKDIYYWSLLCYVIISFFLNAGPYRWGWLAGGLLTQNLIHFNILRISILALLRQKRGTFIIVAGAILNFICFVIFLTQGAGFRFAVERGNNDFFLAISTLSIVLYNLTVLSIPLAVSIYLGLESAFVNDSLQQKLKEVSDLSEKNLVQEREKQQFLASHNETLERQVGEQTSELRRSLKELKETQTQLVHQQKMASLGELTAGIAHEIQNPLNFVNNFSDVNKELLSEMKQELDKGNLIEAKELANDVIDNEEKINHHGKRADNIVKGMLQHSRTSTGQKEPTDINGLVDEYLRLAYHGLRAKDKSFNARFESNLDPTIEKIDVIRQDIARVILNLINNAFYSVNEKRQQTTNAYEPTVTVSTKKLGGKVEIRVIDNGNGIAQNLLEKVFQPFFTTKPPGQGTGLGLSLSYDIIKAHGGEFRVETKEGQFSEFIFQLPV